MYVFLLSLYSYYCVCIFFFRKRFQLLWFFMSASFFQHDNIISIDEIVNLYLFLFLLYIYIIINFTRPVYIMGKNIKSYATIPCPFPREREGSLTAKVLKFFVLNMVRLNCTHYSHLKFTNKIFQFFKIVP